MERLDVLNYIWSRQRIFDRHFIDHYGLKQADREALTKERALYIVGELMDMVKQLPYKSHRLQNKRVIESNVLEELIDIFKYWTGLCLIWDFLPEDIMKAWERKSMVVEQFHRQEFIDPWNSEKYSYCSVIDIDGVLADWEKGFASFIEQRTGVKIPSIECHDLHGHVAKYIGLEQAYKIKHDFREEGIEAGCLEVIDGAGHFMKRLRKDKAYIVIMTSRPYEKYKRLMADTLEWLNRHEIPYNAVIFDEKKEERILKEYPFARYVVEDLLSNANRISSRGINVFLRQTGYNQGTAHDSVIRFRAFKDLEEILWSR